MSLELSTRSDRNGDSESASDAASDSSSSPPVIDTAIETAIDTACSRIAPTWPLDRFIAVNPLWGWIHEPFPVVAAKVGALGGSALVPGRDHFRAAWHEGRIALDHLERAADARADVGELLEWLDEPSPPMPKRATLVDLVDVGPHSLHEHVVDELSRHCASFFDERLDVDREGGLFASWKRVTLRARAWHLGLHELRPVVASLPQSARATLERALDELAVPPSRHTDYLTSLLLDVGGWAAWCAYRRWTARLEGRDDDAIVELLAMRIAWELRALRHGGRALEATWRRTQAAWGEVDDAVAKRQRLAWVWQDALELAYQRPLVRGLVRSRDARPEPPTTPSVQAAFCIDVRSEVFRRALEAQSPSIATLGFAGFFGLPIEYLPLGATQARPQLPGLLAPKMQVTDARAPKDAAAKRHDRLGLRAAWKALRSGALSTFAFVDAVGPLYAGALAWRSTVHTPDACVDHAGLADHEHGKPRLHLGADGEPLSVDARCDLATNLLRGMSLVPAGGAKSRLARLVLLVGHGSATRNNPYAAGLDCGACCGQTGEVNARAAAALLNDPAVRRGLKSRGLDVPDTTHFVAALHVTTTDDVRLFDLDELPASHEAELATLREQLRAAGVAARAERARRLGVEATDGATIEASIRRRAGDWSEVRPEWGLARNAAFVIAPRARTKELSLDGRAFLHEYVADRDEGFAVLELLLTAPMVVTHWINLQYYASTVEPRRYGSGNKVLHDVVGGTLGVFEGNGGDLRIGLPMQSVHDGTRFVHEPLRLSVFVEAPQDAIDAILAKHAHVRALVENGWLHLFRLEGDAVWQRHPEGWRSFHDA
jgi:uncharacterized protein YbcC (UPF0753/DUF2309 family)